MRRVFVFLFSILAIASSCTIEEQVSFNEDYSGEMKFGLRFETKDNETPSGDGTDFELEKAVEYLEEFEGISDVEILNESNGQFVQFEFEDIDALNKGYYQLGFVFLDSEQDTLDYIEEYKDYEYFALDGKTFTYHSEIDEEDFEDMDGAEMMLAMIGYEIIITFPTEIKKVKSKKAEAINNYTLRLKTTFAEIIEDPEVRNFEVKLK